MAVTIAAANLFGALSGDKSGTLNTNRSDSRGQRSGDRVSLATAAVSTSLRVCLLLSAGCASASPSTPDCGDPSRSRCASATSKQACPDDMVFVAHRFCIDRYEASMVDDRTGVPFSPYYPPNLEEMRKAVVGQLWGPAALGKQQLQPPVPLLPEWQRSPAAKARAVSRPHVTPQASVCANGRNGRSLAAVSRERSFLTAPTMWTRPATCTNRSTEPRCCTGTRRSGIGI